MQEGRGSLVYTETHWGWRCLFLQERQLPGFDSLAPGLSRDERKRVEGPGSSLHPKWERWARHLVTTCKCLKEILGGMAPAGSEPLPSQPLLTRWAGPDLLKVLEEDCPLLQQALGIWCLVPSAGQPQDTAGPWHPTWTVGPMTGGLAWIKK